MAFIGKLARRGFTGGLPAPLASARLIFAVLVSAVLSCACLAGAARAQDAGAKPGPVVVELFTSQGCSACPPADRLIAKLSRRPGVFALLLPVDLWDYVGWKDTLALPYHSQRQRQYGKVRGDNRVYTPQAIINGIAHVVGSDPAAIKAQAQICLGRNGALSVSMRTQETPGGLTVELGPAPDGAAQTAGLWLVRVASSREVKIKRGENSGKTFTYVNVARGFQRIGEWTGQPASFTIRKDQLAAADADGWMLFLQAGAPGRPGVILAAAKSPGL